MTERRRPLENDDGQGALFGGEAFAPAGPTPAWKRPGDGASQAPERVRPSRDERDAPAESIPAAPSDASSTEAHTTGHRGSQYGPDDAPDGTALPDADVTGPRGFEPGADDARRGTAHPDADVTGPLGFEPAGDEFVSGTATPASPSPFADEIAELERATERHSPRRPQAPLAGPTLDDVMSRVWEGLVTGLPAACPVCHGELVPALSGPPHGRCSSCGTTID